MITRFPGLTPTRSRAVEHDGLILTVAVAPDPVTPSMYEQTVKALARVDESLKLCGTDKTKIVSATIWVPDIRLRDPMNEAWNAWTKGENLPGRACIEAKLADPQVFVEIAVVAAK